MKFFKNLSWEVQIAVLILLAFAAWYFGKKLWAKFSTPPPPDETVVVNQANLTYPVGDYPIYADQMESAMFDLGTDENAIYAVVNAMQTGDDVRQLIKSFGQRDYYSFGVNNFTGGLIQWLTYEMSAGELEPVRQKFNQLGVAF